MRPFRPFAKMSKMGWAVTDTGIGAGLFLLPDALLVNILGLMLLGSGLWQIGRADCSADIENRYVGQGDEEY